MDNNMDEAKVRQVRADLKDLLERVELDIDAFKKQDEKGGEELENTLSNITFNPDVDGYREKLEEKISQLDKSIEENASNYGTLNDLLKEKEEIEKELSEKYDRWTYLNELAEKIEQSKK